VLLQTGHSHPLLLQKKKEKGHSPLLLLLLQEALKGRRGSWA
jgi:hypothetical protein